MGYKIGKNSEGKFTIIKETPEEEKARLESVAGKIPVMVPILHNIAANVPAVRKYVEETPEMRNYEKFIPAAQVANFVGKAAKSMLFDNPTETDKKNEINRKIANDEPLTEEERNYSLEKNMMAVVDMATPTTTPSGASGLDDIARAQNIKNAGKDLNAMIQGVRNTAKEASNEFRYHTTSKKALENIKDEGLKPARGQYGKGVYFAPSEKMTGGYGSPDEVMIRINKSKLPTDYDEFTDQGWTSEIVPPKYLEYKEKGSNTWKSLTANKVGGEADEVLFHGTSKVSAESIRKGGFSINEPVHGKQIMGRGVYLTPTKGEATSFGDEVLDVSLNPNTKILEINPAQHWKLMTEANKKYPDMDVEDSITKLVKDLGYGGLKMEKAGNKGETYISVFNPDDLKVKSPVANKVGGVQPRTPDGKYDFIKKIGGDTQQFLLDYFHNPEQKVFKMGENVKKELGYFKPKEPVVLYRGLSMLENADDMRNSARFGAESWTRYPEIALMYAGNDPTAVIKRVFKPEEIVVDFDSIPESIRKNLDMYDELTSSAKEGEMLVNPNWSWK